MKRKKTNTYRNLLVQYQGGGYDGCYWEWNFFLFDAKGTFHNLFSSGRKGIKTKEEAKAMISAKDNPYVSLYIYNVKSPKSLKEFVQESHNRLVDRIGRAVNKIYDKVLITWECDGCGTKVGSTSENSDMYHDDHDYRGTTKYCLDCYSARSCGYCGAFNEPEENGIDDEGHCKYCVPEDKSLKSVGASHD